MLTPKVSVGIPVFNGGEFLRKSIESIANQSYQDIEIIISDNCSTDNTSSICLEYASRDSRIRYIRQLENYGSISNFKAILSQATGQYFMWAGADDLLDENWIKSLLKICEANDSLAFGVVQYIDEYDAKIRSTANNREFNFKGPVWLRLLLYAFTPWLFGKMILCWGLFPREKLLDITTVAFDSKWGGAVDTIWVYSILTKCEIISLSTVCLYKRVHQNSESSQLTQTVDRNLFTRFSGFLAAVLKVNMLASFLSLSPLHIKLTLLLLTPFLYPLYVLRSVWVLILYKSKIQS
jgi:glycosyltransferase involved in cell wall biosynthesis